MNGSTNWQWTFSGETVLDHLAGTAFHIGFNYTSTAQQAAAWEIDDVLVTGSPNSVVVSAGKPFNHKHQVYDHSNVRVFPNPVEKHLYIELAEETAVVRVFDLSGAQVLQKELVSNSIYVGNLSRGLYILKVELDQGVFYKKIARQ